MSKLNGGQVKGSAGGAAELDDAPIDWSAIDSLGARLDEAASSPTAAPEASPAAPAAPEVADAPPTKPEPVPDPIPEPAPNGNGRSDGAVDYTAPPADQADEEPELPSALARMLSDGHRRIDEADPDKRPEIFERIAREAIQHALRGETTRTFRQNTQPHHRLRSGCYRHVSARKLQRSARPSLRAEDAASWFLVCLSEAVGHRRRRRERPQNPSDEGRHGSPGRN